VDAELFGLGVGFVLTLAIFSYLLGDNFLYRLAVYLFVGVAAGYVTRVTVESVLLPWLRGTLLSGDAGGQAFGAVPLVIGLLLLFRGSRLRGLGNLSLAFIIGVGTAVALVGAVSGTLIPLAGGVVNGLREDVVNGFLVVVGVICTLLYFQFLGRRTPGTLPGAEVQRALIPRAFGAVGQGVVVITLGALYGGAILTGLTIFSERLAFILARFGGG